MVIDLELIVGAIDRGVGGRVVDSKAAMETFKPSWWHGLSRLTRSYEVSDDALTIRWGVARRRHNRIPRSKITNVDVSLNYLNPGSSVVRVNVGSGEPIKRPGLTRRNAKALAGCPTRRHSIRFGERRLVAIQCLGTPVRSS